MDATTLEWLNLVVRWVHVIAAIMWIGDSFLFMWLDSHLGQVTRAREGAVVGELWMVHSGGFYEVVKRKSLAAEELPPKLYWFKWESYSTWISGFFLLGVVYWAGAGVYLVDPSKLPLTPAQAVGLSLGLLVLGWLAYDTIWRVLGPRAPEVAKALSIALLVVGVMGVYRLFPGRAAYLHVGAMLGTVMAGNVFFRIIPAQRHMLAQTHANQPVDTSYGARAKQRSTHNHYLTLPVLFAMLSNHFPSTYGSAHGDVVLLLVIGFGAALKYVMNFRLERSKLVPALGAAALAGAVGLTVRPSAGAEALAAYAGHPPVAFADVAPVLGARCLSCHAEKPTNPAFPAPPSGVVFDTPARAKALAERIAARAVLTETMPLGNLTGMTREERTRLGAWIAQGAPLDARDRDAPYFTSSLGAPAASAVAPSSAASPAEAARATFAARCATCHGEQGHGDGPAAKALNPPPQDLGDPAWHDGITDDVIADVIRRGGVVRGKSVAMPANADLAADEARLAALVAHVRSLRRAP